MHIDQHFISFPVSLYPLPLCTQYYEITRSTSPSDMASQFTIHKQNTSSIKVDSITTDLKKRRPQPRQSSFGSPFKKVLTPFPQTLQSDKLINLQLKATFHERTDEVSYPLSRGYLLFLLGFRPHRKQMEILYHIAHYLAR